MDANIATFAQGQCANPGLQYSSYPYQVPDGHGALAAYYAGLQSQMSPQGWFGNVLGQIGQPLGAGFGGTFSNPQFSNLPGGWGTQLQNLIPISPAVPGFHQIAQPVAGVLGQQACAFPGGFAAGYAPQQPLASQGWLGSVLGQTGQPSSYGIGGYFGTPQMASYASGLGSQLFGFNPLSNSPQAVQAAQYAAQQAAQVGQQVAQQAAQQIAQQATQAAQHVASQVALQAAHLVSQQAAQVAQQVASQVAAACIAQQTYAPWNVPQYATPQQWGSWGAPYAFLQPGIRGLNPFAGAPLVNQTQLGATPRFSFA